MQTRCQGWSHFGGGRGLTAAPGMSNVGWGLLHDFFANFQPAPTPLSRFRPPELWDPSGLDLECRHSADLSKPPER